MIGIRQVRINILNDNKENYIKKIKNILHIKEKDIKDLIIIKKNIDARDKNNINFVYEFGLKVINENNILKRINNKDVYKLELEEYKLPLNGSKVLKNRPVIVGSGPAGLFAALILAEAGFKPIIIERGKELKERIKDVEEFWQNNKLNVNSNCQFGEGGAGTFSDGKLNTLIKDQRHLGRKVFSTFVKAGAKEEIMYLTHPHVGTDNLRIILKNMHELLEKMGVTYLFNSTLTDIIIKNNKIEAIEINHQDIIPCEVLVLAIGHSAKDTFYMLNEHHLKMESKPFAVGIRVRHKQSLINEAMYGKYANYLGNASYKLTYQTKEKRGVYSFCMCPGGYIVNASSDSNHLVINGMSNYNRDSSWDNSAIVVTVDSLDFGSSPFAGLHFQEELERKAYELGHGYIPIQKYIDFKNNKISSKEENIEGFKGKTIDANLRDIFPEYINKSLLEAFPYFNTRIKEFNADDVILAGVEDRTSSAIRIIRDDNLESNIKGIYPAGEGAGYAGGITSSAIDGIKVAEAIIKKYKY